MVKSFFALAMVWLPRLLHALDQFHRARGRTHLALVDDIGEHVARRLFRARLVDPRQIVGLAARGPELQPLGPGVELLWWIAGLDLVVALLQPGIAEIADHIGDRGIAAVLGERYWRFELYQERDEGVDAETRMAHLDDVPQRAAVELARQQFQE